MDPGSNLARSGTPRRAELSPSGVPPRGPGRELSVLFTDTADWSVLRRSEQDRSRRKVPAATGTSVTAGVAIQAANRRDACMLPILDAEDRQSGWRAAGAAARGRCSPPASMMDSSLPFELFDVRRQLGDAASSCRRAETPSPALGMSAKVASRRSVNFVGIVPRQHRCDLLRPELRCGHAGRLAEPGDGEAALVAGGDDRRPAAAQALDIVA